MGGRRGEGRSGRRLGEHGESPRASPTATLTGDGLAADLTRLYDMPASVSWRQEESRRRGKPTISSADAAKAKVKEIRDSSVGVPEPEEFV